MVPTCHSARFHFHAQGDGASGLRPPAAAPGESGRKTCVRVLTAMGSAGWAASCSACTGCCQPEAWRPGVHYGQASLLSVQLAVVVSWPGAPPGFAGARVWRQLEEGGQRLVHEVARCGAVSGAQRMPCKLVDMKLRAAACMQTTTAAHVIMPMGSCRHQFTKNPLAHRCSCRRVRAGARRGMAPKGRLQSVRSPGGRPRCAARTAGRGLGS